MHLDMLFYISVRGKLSYFNMAIKFKMAAIDRFEGLYAVVMRTCIKPWGRILERVKILIFEIIVVFTIISNIKIKIKCKCYSRNI